MINETQDSTKTVNPLLEKVQGVIPEVEWPIISPLIQRINELKLEKNAVVLAHNYQSPEIYHCVADFVGDSLQLAVQAQETEADIIVQAGVHFMAETSKLLSPDKTVLIPSLKAGCSLASSIKAGDVRQLKLKYPGVPVVTYVNTSADVKAESDICCTSANAIAVVESLGVERVILLPDEFLSKNVAARTEVQIIAWQGRCEVHERFTAEELRDYRRSSPGVSILAHPECSPEVLEEADFAGSTSSLINYVHENRPPKVMMVTECSMSDNVSAEIGGEVEFIRPCNLCPHMKTINLHNIVESLELMRHEITIPEDITLRARRAVQNMVDLGLKGSNFENGVKREVIVEDKISVSSLGTLA